MSKNKISKTIFPIFFLLLNFSTLCFSTDVKCQINSLSSLMNCILENHYEIKNFEYKTANAILKEDQAQAFINPELSSRTVFGNSLGDRIVNTDVALLQTIEFGGKKTSRYKYAQEERNLTALELVRTKEQVLLNTIKSICKIKHLSIELDAIDETLSTFADVQKIYHARGKKTPEQEISLGLINIAKSDYILKKNMLHSELTNNIQIIENSINQQVNFKNLLADIKFEKLYKKNNNTQINSTELKISENDISRNNLALEVEKSLSWPNLKIGPVIESQTTGPLTYQTFGFNFTIELPIFNLNLTNREIAKTNLENSQYANKFFEQQTKSLLKTTIEKYNQAVESLTDSIKMNEINKLHRQTDTMFQRGIIPIPLLIETHRQIIEFTKSKHENEFAAIESLWQIYILEGKVIFSNYENKIKNNLTIIDN